MTDVPPSTEGPTPHTKLFIRSEVLAVVKLLGAFDGAVPEPSKQDKIKHIKRLQAIDDQISVQKTLLKELQRCTQPAACRMITELLMELGDIEILQEPLWALIQNPKSSDDVKDSANLILRHLGDSTDPAVYLDYLDDPAALISRETERMLEVSTRNPEALIDFIDFLFSLPVDEQCSLIRSLHADYPQDYLLNIFIPMLLSLPPLETQELLLQLLSEIRLERVALFLHDNQGWFSSKDGQGSDRLARTWKKASSALKIAGLYREEKLEDIREHLVTLQHPVIEQSTLYQCFATIHDGIGNQGIIISRERENGDIMMMSVATNDLHGVLDCFGFYELARTDFHRLTEKFHEESSRIHTSPAYCLRKLQEAEALNQKNRFRLPYEYSCWKVLLDDVPSSERQFPDLRESCSEWANPQLFAMTANLYLHPDFSAWFLEEGDHPVVTDILNDVILICIKWLQIASEQIASEDVDKTPISDETLSPLLDAFLEELDVTAIRLSRELLATDWREILTTRLADAAFLLREQKAMTFASLAATEVIKLLAYRADSEFETPLEGFIKMYGRRCVEECLLRLKQEPRPELSHRDLLERFADHVMESWDLA